MKLSAMQIIMKNLMGEIGDGNSPEEFIIKTANLKNGSTVYMVCSERQYFVCVKLKDKNYYESIQCFGGVYYNANNYYNKIIDSEWVEA